MIIKVFERKILREDRFRFVAHWDKKYFYFNLDGKHSTTAKGAPNELSYVEILNIDTKALSKDIKSIEDIEVIKTISIREHRKHYPEQYI